MIYTEKTKKAIKLCFEAHAGQVDKSGIPYVHGHTAEGQEIFDYMQRITIEAGLNARLSWDGDEAVLGV